MLNIYLFLPVDSSFSKNPNSYVDKMKNRTLNWGGVGDGWMDGWMDIFYMPLAFIYFCGDFEIEVFSASIFAFPIRNQVLQLKSRIQSFLDQNTILTTIANTQNTLETA